jgi:hypothetical protein
MWLPAMTDALITGRIDVAMTCGLIPAPAGIANEVCRPAGTPSPATSATTSSISPSVSAGLRERVTAQVLPGRLDGHNLICRPKALPVPAIRV